ncbi:MAG: hypothetical protein DMG60_04675 [Acidobacteria bacterium]|nr:MAG: hypothetical protein DMG60_04675 [Acidobacteriota bacterium]
MKMLFATLASLLVLIPSASHSKYQRPVQVSAVGQNYVDVDELIWNHARRDLGDLRLAAGDAEVPYAIVVQHGSSEEQRTELPVLQQTSVGGKTQFLIDMSGLTDYDHVQLKLATRNFVAHAKLEGADDPHTPAWATLGSTILYDLSRESLGSNSMLRLPRATYKYVRVTIDGPVAPSDVQGAASEMAEEHPAIWRDVSGGSTQAQSGKDTVFTFTISDKVPIERIDFSLDGPPNTNFHRDVEIRDEKDNWIGSGDIERVQMVRGGRKIDSEQYAVSFSAIGHPAIRVLIHNGDDRPLNFGGARLQQLERRVYFESTRPAELTLYYGDEKLNSPVYDYAKLFQQSKNTVAATLGPDTVNVGYAERPNDRPWSELHPVVLWMAIIAAVVGLGVIALRSMRTVTS